MALSTDEVKKQSEAAFKQWGPTWEHNAVENGKIYKKQKTSHKQLLFEGAGRTLLCIAMAPSFENKLEIIKKYNTGKYDIACVDKCLGVLLDNGIVPKYVFLADSGISYDKWLKPWIKQTKNIYLMTNVTANLDWTRKWRGKIFFYVNKDNIQTEEIYMPLSGCTEQIPASSNVGNSVVVFSTQILGYKEYLLVGYDYCWRYDQNYYAFHAEDDPNNGKRYWMKHIQMVDINGDIVDSSQNLLFSARWLSDYNIGMAKPNNIRIVNCSGQGILKIETGDLEKKLRDATVDKISGDQANTIYQARMEKELITSQNGGPEKLSEILKDVNVSHIEIFHIPNHTKKFVESRL